jgi:hypothetical protein
VLGSFKHGNEVPGISRRLRFLARRTLLHGVGVGIQLLVAFHDIQRVLTSLWTAILLVSWNSTLCHSTEEVSAAHTRANSIRFPPSQHIFLNDVLTLYAYVLQLRSDRFLEEFP